VSSGDGKSRDMRRVHVPTADEMDALISGDKPASWDSDWQDDERRAKREEDR
jgi:hypothetical protein